MQCYIDIFNCLHSMHLSKKINAINNLLTKESMKHVKKL